MFEYADAIEANAMQAETNRRIFLARELFIIDRTLYMFNTIIALRLVQSLVVRCSSPLMNRQIVDTEIEVGLDRLGGPRPQHRFAYGRPAN